VSEQSCDFSAILVGCGSISNTWLDACSRIDGLRITGLVDLDRARAETRRDRFRISAARVGTDLEEMLRDAGPDLVFNCTVPAAHHEVVMTSLQAGCHVLGEKPMATNLQEAREMVETARKRGRRYAVTENHRHLRKVRDLRAFLQSGEIGPLTELHTDFFIAPHYDGFRRAMRHVLLSDMAIHAFDVARFLTGADPISVYAEDWAPMGCHFEHGASVLASFEMTGEIRFTYRGSWADEGCATPWEGEWRIVGRNGTVRWKGAPEFEVQTIQNRDGFLSRFDSVRKSAGGGSAPEGHEAIIREFLNCLRKGATPETDCANNFKTFAMVMAAIESAETGRRVPVPEY
jgi:predicted dehydrogenase